eukprot:178340-Rhodomonas_salina.1
MLPPLWWDPCVEVRAGWCRGRTQALNRLGKKPRPVQARTKEAKVHKTRICPAQIDQNSSPESWIWARQAWGKARKEQWVPAPRT